MGEMNKLTALDNLVRALRSVAAGRWDGEAGRRQRLVGRCDPGGERRHLFGAGEDPTEAAAEAKQEVDSSYPPSSAPPTLMSAKTAALMCSAKWGQAETTSVNSGLGSVTSRD